jgi:hypothetical protein
MSKITILSADVIETQGTTQSTRIEVLRGDPKSMEMLEKARGQDARLGAVPLGAGPVLDRRNSMDAELTDNYRIRASHGIRTHQCRNHAKAGLNRCGS